MNLIIFVTVVLLLEVCYRNQFFIACKRFIIMAVVRELNKFYRNMNSSCGYFAAVIMKSIFPFTER